MKLQRLFALATLLVLGVTLLAAHADALRLGKKQQEVIDLSTWLEEHEQADRDKSVSGEVRQDAVEDDATEERELEAEERRRAVAQAQSDSEADSQQHAPVSEDRNGNQHVDGDGDNDDTESDDDDDREAPRDEQAQPGSAAAESASLEDGMPAASLETIPRHASDEDDRDRGRAQAQAQTQTQAEEADPAAGSSTATEKNADHPAASNQAGGQAPADHGSVSGGGVTILPPLQLSGASGQSPSHVTLSGGAATTLLSDTHNPFNPNHPFNPQNSASLYTSTIGRDEVNQPFGEAPKSGSGSGSSHQQSSGQAASGGATSSSQAAPAF